MPNTFELNPTFCFVLLGTFAIYLGSRPPLWHGIAVCILASGTRAVTIHWTGSLGTFYGASWISWGAFLGIASLMALFAESVLSRKRLPQTRLKFLRQTFFAGAIFPLCTLLLGEILPLTTYLRPWTYDRYLLAFDGSLGFQPSFVAARLIPAHSSLWGLTATLYYALPLAISILYAANRPFHQQRKRPPVHILNLLLALISIGFILYALYPAVGPKYAFSPSYPSDPQSLARNAIQPMHPPNVPRNCMPSLHLAAALVIWWNSRHWQRWGRALAGLFLGATVFSTLALGEHYLVDLVVAVPFTLIFQAACTASVPLSKPERRQPFGIGIALTVLWLMVLRYGVRFFMFSSVLSWSSILATVTYCWMLERKLSKTAQKRGEASVAQLQSV